MLSGYRRPRGRHGGAVGGAPLEPGPLQQADPPCDQWLRAGDRAADGVVGPAHQCGELTTNEMFIV